MAAAAAAAASIVDKAYSSLEAAAAVPILANNGICFNPSPPISFVRDVVNRQISDRVTYDSVLKIIEDATDCKLLASSSHLVSHISRNPVDGMIVTITGRDLPVTPAFQLIRSMLNNGLDRCGTR